MRKEHIILRGKEPLILKNRTYQLKNHILLYAALIIFTRCQTPAPVDIESHPQDFSWEQPSPGVVTITRYRGHAAAVGVPQRIQGLPVTAIGRRAFRDNTTLTRISIPASVATIGSEAFAGCTALEEVVLPEGVRTLGFGVFRGCTALERLVLPATLERIRWDYTAGCTGLVAIEAPTHPHYRVTDGVVFTKDGTTLVVVPPGKKGRYRVPPGVEVIGFRAFGDCRRITAVIFPPTLTAIEEDAFSGCTALTSVTLPAGLLLIEPQAFYGCDSLDYPSREAIRRRFGSAPFAAKP